MRHLGRCGRSRKRRRHKAQNTGVTQGHLPQYVSLQKWFTDSQEGAAVQSCLKVNKLLTPCDFKDTGRGLQTSKRIRPGDTIVSIPLSLLITTQTVIQSGLGLAATRSGKVFTPQQLLTMFLVNESCQGSESFWSPYINTLPAEYSTPLYFSADELNLLQGDVRSKAKALRNRFSNAVHVIKEFIRVFVPTSLVDFTEDRLRWAWSTVDTRSVYLQTEPHSVLDLDPDESNVALAPFLDLLNHSSTASMTASVNEMAGTYDLIAGDLSNKWDQVFISYGAHDNRKLLVNYGFVLPYNVHNVYSFSTNDLVSCLPRGVENLNRKLQILEEAHLHRNLVCSCEGLSWSAITAIKILLLPWNMLARWKDFLQGFGTSLEVDTEWEKAAVRLLQTALKQAKEQLVIVKTHKQEKHHYLFLQLGLDDVNILQASLDILAEEKTS